MIAVSPFNFVPYKCKSFGRGGINLRHHESFGVIGALDDFSFELRQEFRERPLEFGSLIAAVGK
jgi:hypothetical protein